MFVNPNQWQTIARRLRLTPREWSVVNLLANDLPEKQIAKQLGISEHTVHTHIARIYQKTGVNSRVRLLVLVFETYVAEFLSAARGG